MCRLWFGLALCLTGMSCAHSPFLWAQQSLPPDTAGSASPETPATKTDETAFSPLEQAERLYKIGKFEQAAERYNAIVEGGPDRAVAYAGLARTYLKLGKAPDAHRAASKAVESGPALAAAHSALGEVYIRQGKLQEAETEFLAALKADPADARSYLGLARLHQASYDFKKAKVAIDKAYRVDPADPDIAAAWVNTRSLAEQAKALEGTIDSPSNYYSRVDKAGFKQRLTVIGDQIAHPERTCGLVSPPEKTEIRLSAIGPKSEFIGARVEVNGAPSRLVVSTVSSGIVINRRVAELAGVQPISREDLDALGEQNPPEAYVGFAHSLKIEGVEFRNCYVTVIEKSSPRSFYDQVDGLIAAGFFSNYLVDLDIPNATLKLGPLPVRPAVENQESAAVNSDDPDAKSFHDRYIPKEMAAWLDLYRFGSAIVIPARVNGSGAELFEVASSTAMNVLSADFAREQASLKPDKVSANLEGINGRVSGETIGQVALEFANLRFKAVRVISFNDRSSESAETEIAGYLGTEILRNLRITIDYRDGLIRFIQERKPKPVRE